jgi:hypothetical protein
MMGKYTSVAVAPAIARKKLPNWVHKYRDKPEIAQSAEVFRLVQLAEVQERLIRRLQAEQRADRRELAKLRCAVERIPHWLRYFLGME